MAEEKHHNECGTFGDNVHREGESPDDSKLLKMLVANLYRSRRHYVAFSPSTSV